MEEERQASSCKKLHKMDKNAISYFQESIRYDILKEESFFLIILQKIFINFSAMRKLSSHLAIFNFTSSISSAKLVYIFQNLLCLPPSLNLGL